MMLLSLSRLFSREGLLGLDEHAPLSRSFVEPGDFAAILCYPRPEAQEMEARLRELASIGVETLELSGTHQIGHARVLGKGCVGIVVKALMHDKPVALKIRRVDADRRDMNHEADMLRLANSVNVGPRFLAQSENFLVMELINGLPLNRWFAMLPRTGCKRRVRRVIEKLLDDCYKMDRIALDHGELSEAPKNVLVDQNGVPRIVDFESASDSRRPSNVTSIAQYLLIGGGPAKRVRAILGWRRKASLIRALRDYKHDADDQAFQRIRLAAEL
jgi:putative serine/threonine protein kinase